MEFAGATANIATVQKILLLAQAKNLLAGAKESALLLCAFFSLTWTVVQECKEQSYKQ